MGKCCLVQNMMWVVIVVGQIHGYGGCLEKERNGLLELKDYLISFGVLPYWPNDTKSDCCRWRGIKCDLNRGRVIGLSLYESVPVDDFSYLSLNLSLLYPFEELQSLDLSVSPFGDWFDDIEGYKSLGRLRKLEILDLYMNDFDNSILPFLNAAESLKKLILGQNELDGGFPIEEIKNLRNLEVLDLGENNFNGSLQGHEFTYLHKLKALDLSGNKFSGSLKRQGICELKELQELDLSRNEFEGQVPLCLGSLSKLQVLDLSANQFSGKLPSFYGRLESLEYLSLSDNNFVGSFSLRSIANLSKLEVFKLSSRSNLLRVEIESSWQPNFHLSSLVLAGCNIGKVPSFLMHQKNLRRIDLSNNGLSGAFPSWLLENNTELEVLLLGINSFSNLELPRRVHNLHVLDISVNNFGDQLPDDIGKILPHLRHMNLSHNGFRGSLPTSLGEMKVLQFLDLSSNYFSGGLPESLLMGCYSLLIFKISHNNFSGSIFAKSTNLTHLRVLSMDNNRFMGTIGDGLMSSRYLRAVDMSNNSLTGAIPSWICKFRLFTLSISNNQLQGTIPLCLYNINGLTLLDLSQNMLSGTLPPRLNSSFGGKLSLHNNNLTGPIPDTLLENVTVLDLRHNRLSGSIPQFINNQTIRILLLGGNDLRGHIPPKLCDLSYIRLLDLSHNMLNGSIPPCLSNMSFESREDDEEAFHYRNGISLSFNNGLGTYRKTLLVSDELTLDYATYMSSEIQFAAKQRYESYTGGALGYMFGLDLSRNDLSGGIPVELGNLRGIRALNLSRNSLWGSIPYSFSNLKHLESLDLSFNRLSGRIPPQLTQLDSLVVCNVSYNNLSGLIPESNHFNTLAESNFIGNPLLSVPPTKRSSSYKGTEEPAHVAEEDEAAIDMETYYWSLAVTYVTVFAGFIVFVCFDSPWRRKWFSLVDAFIVSVKTMWN